MGKGDLKVGHVYKYSDRHFGFGFKFIRSGDLLAWFTCVRISKDAMASPTAIDGLKEGETYGIGNLGIELDLITA